MHCRFAALLATVVLVATALATDVVAQTAVHAPMRGVALVMGVSDYVTVGKLDNPANDARAVDTALRELGFDTTLALDPTLADAERALAGFYGKVGSADVVLFYFAGHGVQINGRGFLLPGDVDPRGRKRLAETMLAVDEILHQIEARARKDAAKVVILDACRDNPLLARHQTPQERITRGLARLHLDAPAEQWQDRAAGYFRIVAYATAPNTVAADGEGAHSPYTRSLIRHIREPGIELRDMFVRVAADVVQETRGLQRPEYLAQTSRQLFLRPPAATECDRLAIEGQNFMGIAGVPFDDVDPSRAVPACEAALAARPASARLNNNLARAYEKAGRLPEAFRHYKAAADAGYPPAINALGIAYLAGCGLPAREVETGIRTIARARALGSLSARATLTSHDVLDHVEPQGVTRLQRALAADGAYRGPADGARRPELRAALAAYQTRHKLEARGLTLETIHALGLYDIVPEGFRCH